MNKKTRPKPRLSRYSWLEVALDLLFIVKEADRIRLDFIRDQFERMGFLGLDLENRSRLFLYYAMSEPAFFNPPDEETAMQLSQIRLSFLTAVK